MKTEAPEGWRTSTIGQEADLLTGFPFPSSGYSAGGVRLVRGSNVKRGTLDWAEPITEYWPQVHSDISRYQLREGDLVVAMDGALVGRSFAAIDKKDVPSLLVQRVARLRSEKIQQGLIAAWIGSRAFESHVDALKTQTAIPHISPADIRAFPIVVPNQREEQTAVVSALSDINALLSSLDALIAKKRDIKQAAMQQLLTGKARLPGFEEGWTVKRLDQLASIRSGGTPSTTVSRFWDGGIPWCTPTDITRLGGGKYLLDTSRQITPEGLSNSSAELIPANSVVMTSRATIGECAINLKPVTTNQGFKNFVPFEDTDVSFLYYLLQTQRQGFIQLCSGSTFLEIGKTQLAAYKVHLPSTKVEQTAIAEVLSDMDAELAALEARRDKTRLLKQGMMQELLTGKTRLV
ncbi:restriction endonuclease subunit S [Burkholderia vietnamiensis]|uniref:restriction endonuclease subunit S n=1 Tax=Burkholderia vietnamiensis TaxID=60552 RepID=UPI0009BEACCD|nr:restriction endonuclease subunit S [Burkholderia vietnamiensis]